MHIEKICMTWRALYRLDIQELEEIVHDINTGVLQYSKDFEEYYVDNQEILEYYEEITKGRQNANSKLNI